MTRATRPDGFDLDWLAGCLGQPPGSLTDLAVDAVGTGQMCDSFRLSLNWTGAATPDAPATVVAKCPAADEQSRQTAKALHNYEVEVRWYQTFAAEAGIRVPHCYFADIADDMTDFWLLLEDLAPAEQGDQLQGASIRQVSLALREIAALHAFRWNDPGLDEIGWLNYGAGNREFVRQFLPSIYGEWRARYEGRIDSDILDMGAALTARIDPYLADRDTPRAITHGDLRLDNILFTDRDGRAVIVDWQTITAGSPLGDVAYLIGTSFADPHQRASEEEPLVRDYYARLHRRGAADYNWNACWRDYRLSAFGGFIMGVIAAMLVERTPRGDEMFAVMAERSGRQAIDLDSLSLL